ncbi:MAG: STAS domain-containing protein [Candidatus Poribacteria bacterium]|nr:STAS domain-containing protein [Candidatus Poribacteria bacterium]MDE0504210.1 STAS domain-containing protein [Candidatus Poribacteria bacterium]
MFQTSMSQYDTPILRVNGKIIGNTVDSLRHEMKAQIEQGGGRLILDLTNVPLLDSAALGAIIATLQALKKSDGRLVILNPQEAVQNVLAVTRLDTVLEIYQDEADAVSAFN